jgi:hypothetical protein
MNLRGTLTGIAAAQERLRSAERRYAYARANPKSPGSGRTGAFYQDKTRVGGVLTPIVKSTSDSRHCSSVVANLANNI